jgi:hypothetical protein
VEDEALKVWVVEEVGVTALVAAAQVEVEYKATAATETETDVAVEETAPVKQVWEAAVARDMER